MKKTNAITIIAVIAIVIGLFFYNMLFVTEQATSEEPIEEIVIEEDVQEPEEIVAEPEIEENEIVEETEEIDEVVSDEIIGSMFPEDMSEYEVKNVIHAMSHSKVRAEQKWSFMLLTKQRVENLIKVVEANEYEYEAIYLDILNRWVVGDFSKADEDHNAIWTLQGGTVGRATGILSAEEERAYLESQDYDPDMINEIMSDFD
jgi:hypothetical protein